MRFATFIDPAGSERWGVVRASEHGDRVFAPTAVDPDGDWSDSLAEELREGPEALMARVDQLMTQDARACSAAAWPLEAVELLAPIPRPRLCWGLVTNAPSFQRHRTDLPILNLFPLGHQRPLGSVIGPGAAVPITRQHGEPHVGYNVELGVVIGRGGRGIKATEAMSHIAGYTVVTDVAGQHYFGVAPGSNGAPWSLPAEYGDWLANVTASWGGKIADGHCPVGPWLVTPDEIEDPYDLLMWTRQRGAERIIDRDRAHSGATLLGIERVIEWFSAFVTLCPGDIIHFGTMGVDGLPVVSEEIEGTQLISEIEHLGALTNPLVRQHRPGALDAHSSAAVRDTEDPLATSDQWSGDDCRHFYTFFGESQEGDLSELAPLPTPRFLLAPGSSVMHANGPDPVDVVVSPRAGELLVSVELAGIVGQRSGGAAGDGFREDDLLGLAPMLAVADQSFAADVVEPARPGERGAPAMYSRWADGTNVVGPVVSEATWRHRTMTIAVGGERAVASTSDFVRSPVEACDAIAAMTTLFAGDVITLGAGRATIRVPLAAYADGLECRAAIEGLGEIHVRIRSAW